MERKKQSQGTNTIERKLKALGFELPRPPTPAATYIGSVRVGDLLFVVAFLAAALLRPGALAAELWR